MPFFPNPRKLVPMKLNEFIVIKLLNAVYVVFWLNNFVVQNSNSKFVWTASCGNQKLENIKLLLTFVSELQVNLWIFRP